MLDVELLRPEAPRRLLRSEYDELVARGAFEDERVELLQGVLVSMSPIDPAHASAVDFLTELLVRALAGRARVRVQQPLVAADDSEPEPDIAIVPSGTYRRDHPDKALLVIEVAGSSLRKDRLVKAPIYAASGFEEYWIVNLKERVIEVHRDPVGSAWASVTRHEAPETIAPRSFPDVVVKVEDVLSS